MWQEHPRATPGGHRKQRAGAVPEPRLLQTLQRPFWAVRTILSLIPLTNSMSWVTIANRILTEKC